MKIPKGASYTVPKPTMEYMERALDAQAQHIIRQNGMLRSFQSVHDRDVRKTGVWDALSFFLSVLYRKVIK